MKVTFNGKRSSMSQWSKPVRNTKGEFTRKRSKMWLVVIALALYGSAALFTTTSTITYVSADEPLKAIDHTPEKIAALKAETVQLISGCEVPNYKAGDAPIILDTNKKMSIGPLMFQIATVREYEKKLYGKDVTPLEATNIALDPTQAATLASDIVFKEGGVGNWFNCNKKLDIQSRVKLIKELEN